MMNQLGLVNNLLGVDVVCNQQLIDSDIDERAILQTIEGHEARVVITIIGGQGHIFGRGNQQLSAKVIRQVMGEGDEKEKIIIVATVNKLRSLDNRAMIADTGDAELDKSLSGLYTVITGYQQKTLYRLNA